MPTDKPWATEIANIVNQIEEMPSARLARVDVERIFSVGRTAADRIITAAGGKTERTSSGRAKFVSRQDLLDYLRFSREGQAAFTEAARRATLAKKLQETESQQKWRKRVLYAGPAATKARNAVLAELEPKVSLSTRELRITFDGMEDMVRTLFRFGMALANDYDAVAAIVEPKERSKGAA